MVLHGAKRIGFTELVNIVQVAARQIPNRLLGFDPEGELFLELFADI